MSLCMSFSLTNQVWNYFEFCLCKTYFVFEFLKGEWLKILILGKLGFKTCVLKNISSYTHAFLFLIFNALGYVFKNSVFFFFLKKKELFQIFDWSILFFDQSKFLLKILVSLCLVRLIEPVFRSIEHCESSFFKHGSWLFQKSFFKSFFSCFLSLSNSDLAPPQIFVIFYPFSCKVSLSKHR